MLEEISWLKHLRVTGLLKDDPAGRKMEELQALVGRKPGRLDLRVIAADGDGWPKSS